MRAGNLCKNCSAMRSKRAFYCDQCGSRLEQTAKSNSPNLAPEDAERRQVTVLFCDLVDSTPIAEQLDPEDLRELLIEYRKVCRNVVRRIGGQITRFVGDGILILFGFPDAYEEDASSAVRVALAIIVGIRELNATFRVKLNRDLAVHMGIHTGIVVVGAMGAGEIRERSAIVGETPNIAARLEQLATPNSVFISETTHKLLNGRFECQFLGKKMLKGVSQPLGVLQAVGEQKTLTHNSMRRSTKLFGRNKQLNILQKLWSSAVLGKGQAIHVSGDPGIGKSFLLQRFTEIVTRRKSYIVHVCRCSRQDTSSSLFPIIELLRRTLPIGRDGDSLSNYPAFQCYMKTIGVDAASVTLLAFLLSIKSEPPTAWPVSSQGRKAIIKKTLVDWLVAHSNCEPIVLAFEDLQWADASTIDFIQHLISNVSSQKILVVLTSRPEFKWPSDHPRITNLPLGPLSSQDTEALVREIDPLRVLSMTSVHHIVAKTDGVPLFVEEFTKMIISSGAQSIPDRHDKFRIPASLRELLVARLDRQGTGKSLVKLASVLGRRFSFNVLHAITSQTKEELQLQLDALVGGGFLIAGKCDGMYCFRHALIHEMAYFSLLRAQRRTFHDRVVAVLDQQFPELVKTQPELLAYHFAQAERFAEAVSLWQQAGDRSLERSAYVEAVSHFSNGLDSLALIQDSRECKNYGVALRVGLGSALMAVRGYAAPEVEHEFAQAANNCRGIEEIPQLFFALRGLQSYYQVRGPLDTALDIGLQLIEIAQRSGNSSLVVDANRRLSWCLFSLGNFSEARFYLDRAADDQFSKNSKPLFGGAHPSLLSLVNSSWIEWFWGNPTVALRNCIRAVELSRELGHPISQTYSLCMAAAIEKLLLDVPAVEVLASQALEIAAGNQLPYWTAWSNILLGWSEARQGKAEIGICRLRDGIENYKRTGARLFLPYSMVLLAEVEHMVGNPGAGFAATDDALEVSRNNQIRFFDADIYRSRGALFQATGESAAAVEAFERADTIANTQRAATPQPSIQLKFSGTR